MSVWNVGGMWRGGVGGYWLTCECVVVEEMGSERGKRWVWWVQYRGNTLLEGGVSDGEDDDEHNM